MPVATLRAFKVSSESLYIVFSVPSMPRQTPLIVSEAMSRTACLLLANVTLVIAKSDHVDKNAKPRKPFLVRTLQATKSQSIA